MRARLLDMGEVSALRSQSIFHAVAAGTAVEDDPALLLARPAAAYLALGEGAPGEGRVTVGVDLAHCRENRIPVVRSFLGGAPLVIDENHLLFALALPTARAGELDLDGAPQRRNARFAEILVAAYAALGIEVAFFPFDELLAGGRRIGWMAAAELGDGLCLVAGLPFAIDRPLISRLLGVDAGGYTSVHGELAPQSGDPGSSAPGELPDLAAMAEALIGAAEAALGLELIPSMPTPGELDAIFDWDRRLSREADETQPVSEPLPC